MKIHHRTRLFRLRLLTLEWTIVISSMLLLQPIYRQMNNVRARVHSSVYFPRNRSSSCTTKDCEQTSKWDSRCNIDYDLLRRIIFQLQYLRPPYTDLLCISYIRRCWRSFKNDKMMRNIKKEYLITWIIYEIFQMGCCIRLVRILFLLKITKYVINRIELINAYKSFNNKSHQFFSNS